MPDTTENPIFPEIAGREWQQEGLKGFLHSTDAQPDFVVHACPGAGKTRFSKAALKLALKENRIDSVVVVAPTTSVVGQWRTNLNDLRIRMAAPSAAGVAAALGAGKPFVCVMTYQALIGNQMAETLALAHTHQRIAVVFDEIHHLGENASWGAAAMQAFAAAKIRLCLSGTPFRSDDNAIPFVMDLVNDQKVMREPNVSYEYRQAVLDGVCRPIFGHRMIADVETRVGGVPVTINLDNIDQEDEQHARAALRVVTNLSDVPDYAYALIRTAYKRLERIRSEEQPDAAMMIVTAKQGDAYIAAELFHQITKLNATVAVSSSQMAADELSAFKTSGEPCLVNVKMASEGYDCQRIRVIVFLTNVKTRMNWMQTIGRAVRVQLKQTKDDRQDAHIYFPPVPPLQNYMSELVLPRDQWTASIGDEWNQIRDEYILDPIDGELPDDEDPIWHPGGEPDDLPEDDPHAPEPNAPGGDPAQPVPAPFVGSVDNVYRSGIIHDAGTVTETLIVFMSTLAQSGYLPDFMRVMRPERLATEYLADKVMRDLILDRAGKAGLSVPTVDHNAVQ